MKKRSLGNFLCPATIVTIVNIFEWLHLIPNYKVSPAVISKLIKANIHHYYYHYYKAQGSQNISTTEFLIYQSTFLEDFQTNLCVITSYKMFIKVVIIQPKPYTWDDEAILS